MKKILSALVISISALALATYSTFAAWSDTVTVTNNQIQTGTADLQVSTDYGSTWSTSTRQSSMIISNLVPGSENNVYSFSLRNTSTAGVNFRLSGQITTEDGEELDKSQLEIAIYKQGSTPTNGSNWVILSNWETTIVPLNTTLNTGIGNSQNYNIAVRLKDTARDEWQGQNIVFTLNINGEQI